jgi:hypothetical protein
VWFYDLQADGRSLDDKRTDLLPADKLGALASLDGDEHDKNNLPDALARWRERDGDETKRARTDQSFCVPKADIEANGYDLSINRYKAIVHDEAEFPTPSEILDDLSQLEEEIQKGINDLKAIIDELTDRGIVEAARVYESPYDAIAPEGPEAMFVEADLDLLFNALTQIVTSASPESRPDASEARPP